MWWKTNKWKVVVPILILAVLGGAFWYGGGAPGLQGGLADQADKLPENTQPSPSQGATEPVDTQPDPGPPTQLEPDGADQPPATQAPEQSEPPDEKASTPPEETGAPEEVGTGLDPETGKDQHQTDPIPEGKPQPVEPQDVTFSDVAYTCTLSISCATILDNMDWLDPQKRELVAEDGWILEPISVTFYEGESVFNVLLRVCKQQKLHMEYEDTPIYNSAYIEGINNLYQFDCGEQSGWMYKVEDWFPNYGCSRYQLEDGDTIEWVYTCNLGADVGGSFAGG